MSNNEDKLPPLSSSSLNNKQLLKASLFEQRKAIDDHDGNNLIESLESKRVSLATKDLVNCKRIPLLRDRSTVGPSEIKHKLSIDTLIKDVTNSIKALDDSSHKRSILMDSAFLNPYNVWKQYQSMKRSLPTDLSSKIFVSSEFIDVN